jgi:hypothetical protein
VCSKEVETEVVNICRGLETRYGVHFLEMGDDKGHVHPMVQSSPVYRATKWGTIIKSMMAKEILDAFLG